MRLTNKIQNIFTDYEKGTLPKEIAFSKKTFKNLITNNDNENIKFSNDFVNIIKKLNIN